MTYKTVNTVSLANKLTEQEMDRRHPEGWDTIEVDGEPVEAFKNDKIEAEFLELYGHYKDTIQSAAYSKEEHQGENPISKAIEKIHWSLVAYIDDSAGRNSKEANQIDQHWQTIQNLITSES